jgi:general secretion pathway protein F
MRDFRYRALTPKGELVTGVIQANTSAEVALRIDYLQLVLVDAICEVRRSRIAKFDFKWGKRVSGSDITVFTLDLALLLEAGARLDDALELLSLDADVGSLQPIISAIRADVIAGEAFSEALARHSSLFPPIYIALVRVGETSGQLQGMLRALARERTRSESLRRMLMDAIRYPAFLLCASLGVLLFFISFVLPQFAALLRDFNARIDPIAQVFIGASEILMAHRDSLALGAAFVLLSGFLALQNSDWRLAVVSKIARLPGIRTIYSFYYTALFCRNLEVLLTAGAPLTKALRILAEIMSAAGGGSSWATAIDKVRQGGKLSDTIANALPTMAVRLLRLGEETGQLSSLAGRVAEFYEVKLERSIDRVVAFVGPAAIVAISVIIGGLIISVMTSLLSVSQLVG